MPRTRLLLAALPALLADIVRDALAAEPEVEVVGTVAATADALDRALDADGADVVLAETQGLGLPDNYLELMHRHPRLRLVLVAPDGRSASLYRLVPERRLLADVSPRALAEAVRDAARPPA